MSDRPTACTQPPWGWGPDHLSPSEVKIWNAQQGVEMLATWDAEVSTPEEIRRVWFEKHKTLRMRCVGITKYSKRRCACWNTREVNGQPWCVQHVEQTCNGAPLSIVEQIRRDAKQKPVVGVKKK